MSPAPEPAARRKIDEALAAPDWVVLLAQEIADDLRSALAQIEDVLGDLEQRVTPGGGEE